MIAEAFARWDGVEPVLLTGLSASAIQDVQAWHQQLTARHGDRPLRYMQRLPSGQRQAGSATVRGLLRALELDSPSHRGVLAMDELLLRRGEALRPRSPPLIAEDFLEELFPLPWRPPKFCLVLGTSGSSSALHTDPFGWTGWNLLLRGEKKWRFIRPGPGVAGSLYVRPPARTNLAAHGESPVDLFHSDRQQPDLGRGGGAGSPEGANHGADLATYPRAADATVVREVVQGAGEVIVFPASWWHQTLHLSPTSAIASQYVNRHCARHVLDGLVARAGICEEALGGGAWRGLSWPEQVDSVCRALERDGWVPRARPPPDAKL